MKECPLQAVGNKVIIKRDAAETKSAGGIILAESAQEKVNRGVIVSVGRGKVDKDTGKLVSIPVQVGDRVLFKEHGGHEVSVGDEAFTIMRADDVYAVLG